VEKTYIKNGAEISHLCYVENTQRGETMGIIPFLFGAKAGKKKKRSEMNPIQKMAYDKEKELEIFNKTGKFKYNINGKARWMTPKQYRAYKKRKR